jgi:hypothetical protein
MNKYFHLYSKTFEEEVTKMLGIRRGTYMDESTGSKSQQYDQAKNLISEIMREIVPAPNMVARACWDNI